MASIPPLPNERSNSGINPGLEGFTVRTLDELLDHSYYRHRLEQCANELFWKRVFAWRASVSMALAVLAGAVTWFGLELKTIGKKIFEDQALEIKRAGDEQVSALKTALAALNEERATVKRQAGELEVKTVELDAKIRRLDDSFERSTKENEALKRVSEEAKGAADRARKLAEDANTVLEKGNKRVQALDEQVAEFSRDAELLRNIRRLNEEARSVRLFRMILLHSNDTQAFDFDVPIAHSAQTRPVSVTFTTPKVKSDNFAELSWQVRESGRVVASNAATLFPGKEVAVDDRGELSVRVEAVRKQPFARSFLILTVRARAPEEPKPAAAVSLAPARP